MAWALKQKHIYLNRSILLTCCAAWYLPWMVFLIVSVDRLYSCVLAGSPQQAPCHEDYLARADVVAWACRVFTAWRRPYKSLWPRQDFPPSLVRIPHELGNVLPFEHELCSDFGAQELIRALKRTNSSSKAQKQS